jgi:hypothetical protein
MDDSFRVKKQLEKYDQQIKLVSLLQKRQEEMSKTSEMLGRQLADVLERASDMVAKVRSKVDEISDKMGEEKKNNSKLAKRVDEFIRQL